MPHECLKGRGSSSFCCICNTIACSACTETFPVLIPSQNCVFKPLYQLAQAGSDHFAFALFVPVVCLSVDAQPKKTICSLVPCLRLQLGF